MMRFDTMLRELGLAALLLAGWSAAAPADASARIETASAKPAAPATAPLLLAQSVNEGLPGGVENVPSAPGGSRGLAPAPAAPAMAPPPPVPSVGAAAKPRAEKPIQPKPKAEPKSKPKAKKAAPVRSMRGPESDGKAAEHMPGPKGPDDSIPGGAEHAPGHPQ